MRHLRFWVNCFLAALPSNGYGKKKTLCTASSSFFPLLVSVSAQDRRASHVWKTCRMSSWLLFCLQLFPPKIIFGCLYTHLCQKYFYIAKPVALNLFLNTFFYRLSFISHTCFLSNRLVQDTLKIKRITKI